MPPSNTPASSLTEPAIEAFDALFSEISGNVAVEIKVGATSAKTACGAIKASAATAAIIVFFIRSLSRIDLMIIAGD
jgi:hypothetical protein